jgi:hypothetical protein
MISGAARLLGLGLLIVREDETCRFVGGRDQGWEWGVWEWEDKYSVDDCSGDDSGCHRSSYTESDVEASFCASLKQ